MQSKIYAQQSIASFRAARHGLLYIYINTVYNTLIGIDPICFFSPLLRALVRAKAGRY